LQSNSTAGPKDLHQHKSGRGSGADLPLGFCPLDPGRTGVGLHPGVPHQHVPRDSETKPPKTIKPQRRATLPLPRRTEVTPIANPKPKTTLPGVAAPQTPCLISIAKRAPNIFKDPARNLRFRTEFQTKQSGTVPTNRHTTITNDSGIISACFDDDAKFSNC
jgi:hypothetical protein